MKSLIHAVFGKLFPGLFLLLPFGTASAQQAQSGTQEAISATQQTPAETRSKEVAVTYLGSYEEMIVFNVSYPNPEGNKFQLIIKDQDGTELFQDYFSEKSFFRQFRIPKADKEKIVFLLRDKNAAETAKTFEVNVNSRLVREVAVKKVN
jgi:hypothetical protein